MTLDYDTRIRLLRHARSSIEAHLLGSDLTTATNDWPQLPHCGVFITLRKSGSLRGCIGVFAAAGDLPTTVSQMAVAAAHDPRFVESPVSIHELAEIDIEISLLSPLERITDPLAFELGRHGVHIRRGPFVGCFLPEVATERGWSHENFLSECCRQKAGLPPLAWQDPQTEVFRFEVSKIVTPGPIPMPAVHSQD